MKKSTVPFDIFENVTNVTPATNQFGILRSDPDPLKALHTNLITKPTYQLAKISPKSYKTTIPVVCFGAKFGTRNNSEAHKLSGLVCLDFDLKDQDQDKAKKDKAKIDFKKIHADFQNDPYIVFGFFSLSNNLKVVCKVDYSSLQNDLSIAEKYAYGAKTVAKYFKENYQLNVDPSCFSVAQAQALSYDPQSKYNDNAFSFLAQVTEGIEVSKEQKQANNAKIVEFSNTEVTNYLDDLYEYLEQNPQVSLTANRPEMVNDIGFTLKKILPYDTAKFYFERFCLLSAHDTLNTSEKANKAFNTFNPKGQHTIGTIIHYAKKAGFKKFVSKSKVGFNHVLNGDYLDNDVEFCSKFFVSFSLKETKNRILLKAPTGAGKTEFLLRNIDVFAPNSRVWFITPRLSNVKDTAQRVVKKYKKDLNFSIVASDWGVAKSEVSTRKNAKLIISTYESFHVIASEIQHDDIVVFDEAHSINEMKGKDDDRSNYLAFRKLINSETNILLISATPPTDMLIWLNFTVFTVQNPNKKHGTAQIINGADHDCLAYIKAQKHPLILHIDSRTTGEQMVNDLEKVGKKVRLITAKTKNEWENDVINLGTFGADYDVIIASPCISAGVSIFDKHYKEVVFLATNYSHGYLMTAENVEQFTNRLRLSVPNITVFRAKKDAPAKPLNFQKNFDKLHNLANYYAVASTYHLPKEANFLVENETITNVSSMVCLDPETNSYVPNYLAIFDHLQSKTFASLPNKQLMEQLLEYGFSEATAVPDVINSEAEKAYMQEKRTENVNLRLASEKEQIANLGTCQTKNDFHNSLILTDRDIALKRLKEIESTLLHTIDDDQSRFEIAKEVVCSNPTRKEFGLAKKKLKIQFLLNTPDKLLKGKASVEKQILLKFKDTVSKQLSCDLEYNTKQMKDILNTCLKTAIKDVLKAKDTYTSFDSNGLDLASCMGIIAREKKNGNMVFRNVKMV